MDENIKIIIGSLVIGIGLFLILNHYFPPSYFGL